MNAPTVTFRGKPEAIWFTGTEKRTRVKVPEITRSHCDMQAFRNSRGFGSYANSDLFPALLHRELKKLGLGQYVYSDSQIPAVTLDTASDYGRTTVEAGAFSTIESPKL